MATSVTDGTEADQERFRPDATFDASRLLGWHLSGPGRKLQPPRGFRTRIPSTNGGSRVDELLDGQGGAMSLPPLPGTRGSR